MTAAEKDEFFQSNSAYAAARENEKSVAAKWGIGSPHSQGLNAITTALTAVLGGQTDLQAASNTLAPYVANLIGTTYGHGEDKNTAAQLTAHAILGGALAYINGGNAAAGAGSAVAAESIADYLTQPYKDKSAYQNANGEFEANRLPEDVKAQIRDLSSAIGAVVGGVVGESASNAQIGGVIGQNAVENNAVSDIAEALAAGKQPEQQAKERTQELRLQGCAAVGLVGEACSVELRRQGYEIAQETAGILLPTTVYEVVPIGKGVGLAIKGTKKLVAIYKDSKTAKNAAEKAGAKVDNNVYRDDSYGYDWSAGKSKDFNLNLASHWEKHKAEFPELKSQNDYYRYVTNFINNPPKGTLFHTRQNGDKLFFNPQSNTFSSVDKNGSIRTVFRPEKGMDYWQRQIK